MSSSVIILASGFSERMGFDKPLLRFDNKKTFIEKIVSEYKKLKCNKIIIVTGKWLRDKIKKLPQIVSCKTAMIKINPSPDKGRMYSVLLGLKQIEPTGYCFIQDCDNPLISLKVLKQLLKERCSSGFSVPVYKSKRGHPVLISPYVSINLMLKRNFKMTLKEQLSHFIRKKITVNDKNVLVNINTMNDYLEICD